MADAIEAVKEKEEEDKTPQASTETMEAPAEVVEQPTEASSPQDEDLLGMSDEEFEKQMDAGGIPLTSGTEPSPQEVIDDAKQASDAAAIEQLHNPGGKQEEPAAKDPDVADLTGSETDDKSGDLPGNGTDPQQEKESQKPAEKADVQSDPQAKTDAPASTDAPALSQADAASAYAEILQPFQANGRQMRVKNVEEARRLMQAGAGHVKYQNAIRPDLALAQTLKNNGIDASRLNYLIELNNGDPNAIQKLVRDSGLDPYEIKTDDDAKKADKDYRPKDYSASEESVTLNQVMTDTESTTHGKELLDHVRSGDWDDKSRIMLRDDPSIISILADQKQSGHYDLITAEIDRQRALGGLRTTPYLQAYKEVGEQLAEAGSFGALEAPSKEGTEQKTEAPKEEPKPSTVIASEPAPVKQSDTDDKAAAAAQVSQKAAPQKVIDQGVFDMPDDEFEKMAARFG